MCWSRLPEELQAASRDNYRAAFPDIREWLEANPATDADRAIAAEAAESASRVTDDVPVLDLARLAMHSVMLSEAQLDAVWRAAPIQHKVAAVQAILSLDA